MSKSPFSRAPNQTHPWLLVSHGDYFEKHTLYNISKDQHSHTYIPELRDKQVVLASYGWLALLDIGKGPNDCTCCLYNIASNDKISIPHMELSYDIEYYECVLSRPPTDPDCYVMLNNDNSLYFCRIGDEYFVDTGKEFGFYCLSTATSFKGKIYAWMSKSNSLFEVQFSEEGLIDLGPLVSVKEPICTWPLRSTTKEFLVEFCGELLLVHMILDLYGGVVDFRIFTMGMQQGRECSELLNIGDHAIFIGPYGSVSALCTEESGVKKNSIYYYWHDQNIFVHDIEDRTTTLIQPACLVEGFLTPYLMCLMCWI